MTMSLPQKLWRNIQEGGERVFLVSPTLNLTYKDAAQGIRCWLATFDASRLTPGDRFVLRTDDEAAAILAFLAGLVDGVVPVILEGSCPDTRLSAIVSVVEPGLVVSGDALPSLPGQAVLRILKQRETRGGLRSLLGRKPSFDSGLGDGAADRPPHLPENTDDLAYLLFTSGTTSAPTGVRISRSNLAANLDTLTRLGGMSANSRIFNDMILAHADGMIQGPTLAAWNGAAILRAGGFDMQKIEDWLSRIRQYRATHVLSVPTVWAMIDRYAAHDDYFDAPECTMLVTVAAKMPDALWRRIQARFGRRLVNHYGLTETVASALYSGDHPDMGPEFTIGLPVDCKARIAKGTTEGELELKGDNIFSGYWRNEERTRASFTEDGWFKTGDIACARPDGSYDILGRLKTAIMSGGILIRPDEIDEAMLRHPAVIESATVGVPDEMFGEIGVTGVTLSTPVDETALTEHLRIHLEPRKIPKRIFALKQIPRGLSGKVNMNALTALLSEQANEGNQTQDGKDVEAIVINLAAKVFRVPVEQLSPRTGPDDVNGWDSFTQLNLVLTIEEHFGCRIPAARVSALQRLGDFIEVIRGLK
jgi:long-chain acyl-CoA synthetase